MQTLSKTSNIIKHLLLSTIFVLSIGVGCKKKEIEVPTISPTTFSYEVSCNYCDITFTDKDKQTKTIKNNNGQWAYKIQTNFSLDLKLVVKTTTTSYQSIEAYILKEEEVMYGNLGFNNAELSYNTSSGIGKSSFGIFTSSSGGNTGGSTGGSNNGSSTSTTCGARNKTGGYCKRVVSGGGRCWQHR
ncbi:MAG: hypothetical protein EOO87_22245 [Pedobacter sp.]|nr:MAG: hypothetical protein EOO87_22245 [Pedobacter sp.]